MMATLSRHQQKLMDGRYRWGFVSRQTGRYGAESIRLVIYPPNTTIVQRRCARLTRFWPWISIALIVITAPALASLSSMPMAATILSIASLAAAIGSRLTRVAAPVTTQSVELFATVSLLSPIETDRDRYVHADQIAKNLHDAEQHLDHGDLPWSKYHMLWVENYWNSGRGT